MQLIVQIYQCNLIKLVRQSWHSPTLDNSLLQTGFKQMLWFLWAREQVKPLNLCDKIFGSLKDRKVLQKFFYCFIDLQWQSFLCRLEISLDLLPFPLVYIHPIKEQKQNGGISKKAGTKHYVCIKDVFKKNCSQALCHPESGKCFSRRLTQSMCSFTTVGTQVHAQIHHFFMCSSSRDNFLI